MWGGVILALAVLFLLIRWYRPRRAAIAAWLRSRSTGMQAALAAAVLLLVLGVAGAGYGGYRFVETDNRFCNGCHIFVPSGQAWVLPDTGSYTLVPKLEGKHDTLSCHTCHPLKPTKEAVKLVLWMSGVRGDSIPAHAKVPREICEQCHVRGAARETWEAIAATAGHRTHLESDSLAGKVECLTCHARTAHRFPPANETCGQSGCHQASDTRIVLGKMAAADQASTFHCQACHNFIATVPRLATHDSAVATLRPALQQCFACHEMKERLRDFDAARDPHGGTCGMCHNPHVQRTPAEATASCTTARCHADWRSEPFHVGREHRKAGPQCLLCHTPHAAQVDASDCTGCHERVRQRQPHLAPPLPFDTLKALRQSLAPSRAPPPALGQDASAPDPRPQKPKGDGPPLPGPKLGSAPVASLPPDTFPHDTHRKLACLTCHLAPRGEGGLTFQPPRGCQICHHQAPARSECGSCHAPFELESPVAVQVGIRVRGHETRVRPVEFLHDRHTTLACVTCHTTPVTLAPPDSVLACQACHEDHHASGRHCAACHKTDAIATPHQRPADAHTACDACHSPDRVSRLVPTRSFCLTCHDQAQDHYAPRECTACHFLRTPDEFRRTLTRGGER
jgi:hypothetical protein